MPVYCLAILLLLPHSAMGWGPSGHRIIAHIAEQHLTENAAAEVKKILGDQSLADVANWADEIRDQRPETGPWHYLNPSLQSRSVTMKDSPQEGSVLSCIVEQSRLLTNRRSTQIQQSEALRFVIHMVGDIHQPMHVSRARDQGGNTIQVTLGEEHTNLHRAWDSGILNLRQRSWTELAEILNAEITDDQMTVWSRSIAPQLWASESLEHAMGFAYNIPSDGVLDNAYLDQAQNILDERLQMAGIRLAALLNRLFR